MRISVSEKPNAHAFWAYFTKAHGKVYQFALKENVHRGAHALTGLMFAPPVTMFSLLNDRIDSDLLQIFYICISLRHL